MRFLWSPVAALLVVLCAVATPVRAAPCGGDFDAWLEAFTREAQAQGISAQTISEGLSGVTPDPKVIGLDRNQSAFKLTFEEFAARRITQGRLKKGAGLILRNASLLQRIEAQYGVPGEVLVAIWGLETDYGVNQGKQPVLRALATLAHDCRRTDMFQGELMAALRILERGDLTVAEMRGAWAGELGQTQFLPSSYMKFAIDFDGNGKRDLIRSVPDVLASTANYLKGYGWQRSVGYDDNSPNFEALKGWNKSSIYQRTIALFARRLTEGQ